MQCSVTEPLSYLQNTVVSHNLAQISIEYVSLFTGKWLWKNTGDVPKNTETACTAQQFSPSCCIFPCFPPLLSSPPVHALGPAAGCAEGGVNA